MDSTFTTKIGEKFMDSLVNNALNGINSNSNGNSNGSQHQDQPRQYGYHGQPQWYRGHKGRGFHGNPSQGGEQAVKLVRERGGVGVGVRAQERVLDGLVRARWALRKRQVNGPGSGGGGGILNFGIDGSS